jgi:glycosyltransferase involved in cell wall biosynthesis
MELDGVSNPSPVSPSAEPARSTPGRPERGRLLIVLHEPELGGASRAVLRVVPHLRQLGWDISFWVPSPGRAAAKLREDGYVLSGAPRRLRYGLRALRVSPGVVARLASVPGYLVGFRGFMRQQRPDVVHANTLVTIPEAVIARRIGCATVMHIHETLRPGPRGAVAARIVRATVHVSIAPSVASAAALATRGVRARVIPNGVELPATHGQRDGTKRPLVIGTLGTISRRKGSDVFVDAAREVMAELDPSEVHFRMIGPPAPEPERAWAERVLERARAAGIHHGMSDDVPSELRRWDILVMPSREDPFPLAVLEGMASGLAVVGTAVGGIPEQVAGDSGVLVEPDDPHGLATAIVALARDGGRRSALGRRARRRVAAELTLENQALQLDSAYRAAMALASRSSVPGG